MAEKIKTFGSIQVGGASRFSSESKATSDTALAPDVSTVQIQTPPEPFKYNGLKTGPAFTLEYEPNQAFPVDGSRALLRTLSPFMIQVEPPIAYASDPAAFNGDTPNPHGIYAAAKGAGPNPWMTARRRIQTAIPGGDQATTGGSVQEFVADATINRRVGDGTSVQSHKGGPNRIGAPAIADVYSAVDVTMQLRAIVNTPPLVLLINPQSLSIAYAKLQQYGDRTRFGFIFQGWGEEQPRMSISMRCGAFISGSRGVQWASRRDSSSWQNLMTAYHFYRNNGYIHDTVRESNAHHFVGGLSIHYDGWVYYGNMESFTYTLDEATQQGGVTFDMEFVVTSMVDTSQQQLVVSPMFSPIPSLSDPRYTGRKGPGVNQESRIHSVGGQDVDLVDAVRRKLASLVGPGDSQVVNPEGTLRTVQQPLTTTAPSSANGFQVAAVSAPVVAALQIDRRPTPFRVSNSGG